MVEQVVDRREVVSVYNVEVEENHTYFVGCDEWGFSVWAHNADYAILPHPSGNGFALAEEQLDGSFRWVTDARIPNPPQARLFASAADANIAITTGGGTRYTGELTRACS
jgi:hypothetical protein